VLFSEALESNAFHLHMYEEEGEEARKTDSWFALAVAVQCKTDAALQGILNEKDTVKKFHLE